MSKAVLVMDMPSNCSECEFCLEIAENHHVCQRVSDNNERCKRIDYDVEVYQYEKPDWCPLRELPEKTEVSDCGELCDTDDWYDSGYADGYNACIDELLKGEEG